MLSNFNPREGEVKYAMIDGRRARRAGLPRHRPDDLNGREAWAWDTGWDIEKSVYGDLGVRLTVPEEEHLT